MQEAVQEVLEAEMEEALQAEKSERTGGLGYRSGYYSRTLVTRVDKLELRVPQDRQGRFRTEVFERYQRSEKALVTALMEMYLQGVSTRKVKDDQVGQVSIEVVTPAGQSTVSGDKRPLAPAFFMFDPENRKYVAAVHADGTYVGKAGLFSGSATRPAHAGNVILLFGTGFGATDPECPAGEMVKQPAKLRSAVTVRIGNVPAEVAFAGLVSSGLFQFNVTVPDAPAGDQPIVAEVGGAGTRSPAFLTVER
jgi:uncharacterized protein (TIGR03437 family)